MSDQSSDAGSGAASLMAQARDVAGGALDEARSRAGEVASRTASAAKAEAMDRAEQAKDGLAAQGERLAQNLRGALDGGDDSIQARVMAAAADSVSDLADSLKGKSFQELLDDVQGFAGRNPGAFVAAAALAGFAVARFARASTPASQAFADIEGSGSGSSYSSPRQMGSGYAGGSYAGGSSSYAGGSQQQSQGYGSGRVSTASRSTTEDEDYADSSVEATPGADRASGGSLS